MSKPVILFIPVSSTKGIGEYTRSMILAETLLSENNNFDIHFIINKYVNYANDSPYKVHYSQHSATKDTPTVKAVMKQIRPDIVIFDCAGRSQQMAYAKSLGAKVIFISQHKRKRARGLKLQRLLNTDLHWVVQTNYAISKINWLSRIKLNLLSKPIPKNIGPILPKIDHHQTQKILSKYQLLSRQYYIFCSGSGGHKVKSQFAADIYYQSAVQFSQQHKIPSVVIFGPNYPNEIPKDNFVQCYRFIPSAEYIILLNEAKGCVISAGDTLLQSIELQRPCVAAPVSKDQPARLKICAAQGLLIPSKPTVQELCINASLLMNKKHYEAVKNRIKEIQPVCGLDIAIKDINRLSNLNILSKDKIIGIKNGKKHFLFFISQNYSYAILRPLQKEILAQGHQVKWFLFGDEVNKRYLSTEEEVLETVDEIIQYQPDASFVPGNVIPSFIPGVKVAVFHGFNVRKRNKSENVGHFRIRGCFDLYCTQGPNTTKRFQQLSKQYSFFDVVETGWPTMDPLFNQNAKRIDSRPTIIMCSTFTKNLTCAPHLYEQVKKLSRRSKWQWLVQFHPKMSKEIVNMYKQLSNENLQFIETDNVIPLLQAADVMLCDTSSILLMFILQGKPVVTFNGNNKGNHLINFTDRNELGNHLEYALSRPKELIEHIDLYNKQLHPYTDGQSSKRVLDATINFINSPIKPKKKKPLNLLRNFKIRRTLNYWR